MRRSKAFAGIGWLLLVGGLSCGDVAKDVSTPFPGGSEVQSGRRESKRSERA